MAVSELDGNNVISTHWHIIAIASSYLNRIARVFMVADYGLFQSPFGRLVRVVEKGFTNSYELEVVIVYCCF
jgi:hypothetical protein